MGQARLARTRPGAAADDRRGGGAVMRRAERPARDQRPLGREDACNRVDAHHLERLPRLERRQDRRQAPAEHRLPGSGRPRKKQVVAARGRELERTPRTLLAAHVGEIGLIRLRPPRRAVLRVAAAARLGGRRPPRRGGAPALPRPRPAPPRTPTPERTESARARIAARPRRRRTRRARAGPGRRAPARPRPRARASRSTGS